MKLLCIFGLLGVGSANLCKTVTSSADNCQKICQLTSGCGAWAWNKGGNHDCWMKYRTGFTVKSTGNRISGFSDGRQHNNKDFAGGDINLC